MRGKINEGEVLINAVKDIELKLLIKAQTKRYGVGSSTWRLDDVDMVTPGEQTLSNPRVLEDRNWVNLYQCLNRSDFEALAPSIDVLTGR